MLVAPMAQQDPLPAEVLHLDGKVVKIPGQPPRVPKPRNWKLKSQNALQMVMELRRAGKSLKQAR
jgi:hypothetical protein